MCFTQWSTVFADALRQARSFSSGWRSSGFLFTLRESHDLRDSPELVTQETNHWVSTLCTMDVPRSTYYCFRVEQVLRIVTGQYSALTWSIPRRKTKSTLVLGPQLTSCGLSGQHLRSITLGCYQHRTTYPTLLGILIRSLAWQMRLCVMGVTLRTPPATCPKWLKHCSR